MMFNDKTPQHMTSAELEEAIRRHREQTKKLLEEVRARRVGQSALPQALPKKKPT